MSPDHSLTLAPVPAGQVLLFSAAFLAFFGPILAVGARILAGRRLHIPPSRLVAAAGVTLALAAPLEIAVDQLFSTAGGGPAWTYVIAPVHSGFTSRFGILMWPMYGAFVEGVHEALAVNPRLSRWNTPLCRAVLIAVEAMLLEIAANLFCLAVLGRYLFYYHPDDLWHLTTIRIFLPYVAAGYLGVRVLDAVLGSSYRGAIGIVAWAAATLVLAAA
jgi:hypothetical protein